MKKRIKGILRILLIFAVIFYVSLALGKQNFAASLEEEKKKQQEMQKELKNTQAYLKELEKLKGDTEAYIKELDVRLTQLTDNVYKYASKQQYYECASKSFDQINSLLKGGYIHDGEYAKKNGHKGICSASEYEQIERDLYLAEKTGCKYHVCHISTKESVELIRKAKQKGIDATCETAPHYLILDDSDLKEDGRFKMNPPLRSKADKEALIEGIIDGTIDMIATDHAPHSAEEKSKGLEKSAFGIVGIETAFQIMYTNLVKTGVITLEKLIADAIAEALKNQIKNLYSQQL